MISAKSAAAMKIVPHQKSSRHVFVKNPRSPTKFVDHL